MLTDAMFVCRFIETLMLRMRTSKHDMIFVDSRTLVCDSLSSFFFLSPFSSGIYNTEILYNSWLG